MRLRSFRFGVQKGTLLCLFAVFLFTPLTYVLGQGDIDQFDPQFNNPSNPNAPGWFGSPGNGGGTTGDTILDDGNGNGGAGGGGNAGAVDASDPSFNNPSNPNAPGWNTPSTPPPPSNTNTNIVIKEPEGVVERVVYFTSIRVSGWVLRLGGGIFDMAYDSFVLQLGCWFVTGCGSDASNDAYIIGNGQVGGAVNELWQMVRDMFNILFIFALIYIGIRTILFTDDSSTRKMLGMLIVAALLINFSLYIAKTIVDLANFTAVALHDSMVGGTRELNASNISPENGSDGFVIGFADGSIAGHVMTLLQFSSFFSTDPNEIGDGYVIMFSIMMLVFSFILAFTFAYAGLMLLFRFMAIVFYLIFSPMMFLAWVVPQFANAGKKWWSGFLGYAFYAPVFIFLIFISLYTLQALSAADFVVRGDGGFGRGFTTDHTSGMMNSFIFFALAVGFVIASAKLADSIAKQSGAIGMSTASKYSRRATVGATAYVGGRMASSGLGWTGEQIESASNRVPGALGGSHVRRLGEGMQKSKFGGPSSYKERGDATSDHNKKRTRANAVRSFQDTLANPSATPAQLENAFRDISNPQLLEIAKSGKGRELINKPAHMLSASQMKAIADNEDINDTQTGEVASARKAKMITHLSNDANFKKAGKDELSAIGADELKKPANAVRLSDDKIKSLDIAEVEKEDVKSARKAAFIDIITNAQTHGGLDTDKIIASFSDKRLAGLPDDVFTETNEANVVEFIKKIPLSALATIQSEKGADVAKKMRPVLDTYGSTAPTASPREQAVADWLTNDRVGKNFGLN